MQNQEHNFWLYFNKTDNSFSHSCNVRQPKEHTTAFIEVGAEENLPLGWTYYLQEDGSISQGESTVSETIVATPEESALQELRRTRDALLSETDWLVIKSLESGEPVAAEWIAYRQALRDLPNSLEEVPLNEFGNLDWQQITMPVKPA